MTNPVYSKVINYNHATRSFDAQLDGRYIGAYATYSQAEDALNDLVGRQPDPTSSDTSALALRPARDWQLLEDARRDRDSVGYAALVACLEHDLAAAAVEYAAWLNAQGHSDATPQDTLAMFEKALAWLDRQPPVEAATPIAAPTSTGLAEVARLLADHAPTKPERNAYIRAAWHFSRGILEHITELDGGFLVPSQRAILKGNQLTQRADLYLVEPNAGSGTGLTRHACTCEATGACWHRAVVDTLLYVKDEAARLDTIDAEAA